MRVVGLVLAAAAAIGAAPAAARDAVADLLAKAEACAKKGDLDGAASAFGQATWTARTKGDDATRRDVAERFGAFARTTGEAFGRDLAKAHAAGDLLAEQEVADRWTDFAGDLPREEGPALREALAAMATALDPARGGAFVAAHALAVDLCVDATARGDATRAGDAARILAAWAKSRGAGRFAVVAQAWADGLAGGDDAAKADAALGKALDGALAGGWLDVVIHVATERAARRLAASDPAGATAALAAAGKALRPDSDRSHVYLWRALVGRRLAGAPAEVLAPYEAAMRPFSAGSSAGAAGGAGGAGGDATGGEPLSAVGKALRTFPADRVMVTVRRSPKGFEMAMPIDPAFHGNQRFQAGLKYQDHGGLTFGFHGNAVLLEMVDVRGMNGQPGESSAPPGPGRALYRLAEGEVWSLTKGGRVAITAK